LRPASWQLPRQGSCGSAPAGSRSAKTRAASSSRAFCKVAILPAEAGRPRLGGAAQRRSRRYGLAVFQNHCAPPAKATGLALPVAILAGQFWLHILPLRSNAAAAGAQRPDRKLQNRTAATANRSPPVGRPCRQGQRATTAANRLVGRHRLNLTGQHGVGKIESASKLRVRPRRSRSRLIADGRGLRPAAVQGPDRGSPTTLKQPQALPGQQRGLDRFGGLPFPGVFLPESSALPARLSFELSHPFSQQFGG